MPIRSLFVRRSAALLATGCLTVGGLAALSAEPASAATNGPLAYGLTTDNRIISFRTGAPSTVLSDAAVSGLAAGEDLVGIDTRPATGQLIAVSSTSRLYVVDPVTGAATAGAALSTALSGAAFGVDFNPVVDRLRIVSDAEQNLRVHPDTGAVTVDGVLAYAGTDAGAGTNPAVGAAGYTNNVAGTTTTTLFDIDTARDVLVQQSPPNNGTLVSVGSLGIDATAVAGLDIEPSAGTAYAVLQSAVGQGLYTINLTSGAATLVGAVSAGVEDLAIATPRLRVVDGSIAEGSTGTVTVRRTGDTADATTVDYVTASAGATEGTDYTPAAGTLSFAAGETTKTFTVPTALDGATEGTETFTVTLSNATAGTVLSPARGTISITDAEPGKAYGLTTGNQLVTFSVGSPGTVGTPLTITGLQAGEDLVGIDVRPGTGELFGVSTSRLYVINPDTGAAVQKAVLSTPLSGTAFGVDFNPSVDRLRIVSNTGQNLRVVPDTGAVTVDGPLAYAVGDPGAGTTPAVAGAAYANNTAGTATTTLFDIDTARDVVVRQTPPNDGTLATVGGLGVDVADTATVGIDISSQGGAAFAVLTPAGTTGVGLYRLDLSTGAARLLGALGNAAVEDIALASVAAQQTPSPSPSATATRATLTLTVLTPTIPAGANGQLRATGAAGQAYELRCYTRPSTTYFVARQGSFDAAATPVTFTLSLGRNTRCFIQYATNAAQGASASGVINVTTVLSLSAVRTGVRTYVFQGRNLPRVAGQLITLYRVDAAGNEIRTSNLVTDSSGIYRVTRTFTGTGTFRFKVRTSQTLNNAAGVSNTITTSVR